MNTSKEFVQGGIVALANIDNRAKQIAQKAVDKASLFALPTTREWAGTFTQQVTGMVGRLLTPGRDGIFAWQKSPQLLNDLAKFVEDEGREQASVFDDCISLAGTIRAFAKAATTQAVEVMKVVVEETITQLKKESGGMLLVYAGLALVALLLLTR